MSARGLYACTAYLSIQKKTPKRTRTRKAKVQAQHEESASQTVSACMKFLPCAFPPCRHYAQEEEWVPPSVAKKAKAASGKPKRGRKNAKQDTEKENIQPAVESPFIMDFSETGSLRKPSASQISGRACLADLWGGAGRTMQIFSLFDQQRERYECSIADEQRKSEAEVGKARRDAAYHQDKLNLWSVLQ